jgi:hypothetical protein
VPRIQQFAKISSVGVLKPCCTIKRVRIGLCGRMRRYDEPSNKSAASSPSRSLVDYITNTSGYNFRKGQQL